MANIVPGFVWHPIDVSGRAKRAKGRGLVAHVAVSESTNLVPPGTPATRSADWHFYLPKSGPGIQYIDLDYQCWSSAGANATCPAFESQGGVTSPQTEPWTPNQIELAAQILAHLHKTEGTPLQVMPNSLPSSKGIGPHRWGINPWRVSGGEVWSSSNGKVCPGDVKVSQLPQIVARATQIVNGIPTPPPPPTVQLEDDMAVLRDPNGTIWMWSGADLISTPDAVTANVWQKAAGAYHDVTWAELDAVKFYVGSRRDRELIGTQNYILGANPQVKPYLWDRVVALGDAVKAQTQAQTPVLDETRLAAALLADPEAVQALGKAIADNLQLMPRPNS